MNNSATSSAPPRPALPGDRSPPAPAGARTLRVAVLGAGGTIAPAIVRDLAESDEVAGLLLLDLDEARAEHVASLHGGPKARAALADARASADAPTSLARALEGCDVLVNSASYRVNLDAMTACLKAGCHYLDLGGLYWMTGRQLELGPRFEAAGLLALLGIGSAPGKTNLMALRAARELVTPVEAIHVSAAGRDLDPPAGFSVPYALQTLLDELTMRPVVLRDGRAGGDRARSPPAAWWSSASRSGRPRRSTPCTPSCAPSATASVAARRASGSPCRRISFDPPGADRGPGGGDPANRR